MTGVVVLFHDPYTIILTGGTAGDVIVDVTPETLRSPPPFDPYLIRMIDEPKTKLLEPIFMPLPERPWKQKRSKNFKRSQRKART